MTVQSVSAHDAELALIYRNGILDYDAHDAVLRSLGYEYIPQSRCSCGGSEDDGHMPACSWGKFVLDQADQDLIERFEAESGLTFNPNGPLPTECECGKLVQFIPDHDCYVIAGNNREAAMMDDRD